MAVRQLKRMTRRNRTILRAMCMRTAEKWCIMLGEIKRERTFSKKVCSDISFRGSRERDAESEKHQQLLPSLRLSEKKCSKSLDDLCKQGHHVSLSQRIDPYPPYADKYRYRVHGYDYGNKFARRCIVNLLMLNAWRRQKTGYKAARERMDSLNNKVESFEMQVYVLRQLLNAEKRRVEARNDHIRTLLQKIRECTDEKAALVREKENMAKDCNEMLAYCSQMESTLKNQENTIITSKLEIANWEQQLKKERVKIRQMEHDETCFKKKIQHNEKALKLRTQQIEQLIKANKELQQKLDVQVPLWDETMAQVDLANARLKEEEERRSDLEKILAEKEMEVRDLKSTIALLENRLREEDEKNGLLGKSILEKSNELSAIEKKFLELSKNSYPWSAGIIKAASFCAKIPVACMCTVGSLLLPFPSYRL